MQSQEPRPFNRKLTKAEIDLIAKNELILQQIKTYFQRVGRKYWVGRRDENNRLLVGAIADKLFEDQSERAVRQGLERIDKVEFMGKYQPLVDWLRQSRLIAE